MRIGKSPILSARDQKTQAESSKFAISRDVKTSLTANKTNLWLLLLSFFFVFLQSGLVGVYFRNLPPQIPIFYSRTWGETMLGANYFIWFFPIAALSFIIFNFLLYFVFFRNDHFLSRVLFASGVVVGFITFWGSMKIVTLLS